MKRIKDLSRFKQLGRNIEKLRLARKISQERLARAAGVSQPTICNYIIGGRDPQLSTILKIAKFFNVTIEDLLK